MTTQEISTQILNTASAYGVDPRLALEVAMEESGLNQAAMSAAGAKGIFQLMPATAAALGVDPDDPVQNIQGGVELLSQLLAEFAGDVAKALASYDWHPDAVSAAVTQYGADWLSHTPAETQNYVQKIMAAVGSEYSVSVGPVLNFDSSGAASSSQPSGPFSFSEMFLAGAVILAAWFVWSLLD